MAKFIDSKNTGLFWVGFWVIIFLSLPSNLFATNVKQGIPFIRNFSPFEYASENQNFSMLQDDQGVSYFGNQNGILIYDKLEWQHLNLPGFPRLDRTPSGRIYVGGFNEFGYLETAKGKPYLVSLKDKYLKKEDFGLIVNVVCSDENVFFESTDKLFLFHHQYIQLIDAKRSGIVVFKANSQVFINHSTKGLCYFKDNRVQEIPGGNFFMEKQIVDVFFWNGGYYIRTEEDEHFWLFDGVGFKPIKSKADGFLSDHEYSHATVLYNGDLAIGTRGNGILLLNKNGEIAKHINKINGLADEFVNFLYADKYGNLWACLRNGISRIEYPSPFSYFNTRNGFEGGVFTFIRKNNFLYAGTDNGVYACCLEDTTRLPSLKNLSSSFSLLPYMVGIAYQFVEYEDELLLAASKGVYRLKDRKLELLAPYPARVLLPLKHFPDYFLLGSDNGLQLLHRQGDEWFEIAADFGINGTVQFIEEDDLGNVFVSTSFYGLYRIQFHPEHFPQYNLTNYKEQGYLGNEHGLTTILKSGNEILFYTELGLFRFEQSPDFTGFVSLVRPNFPVNNPQILNVLNDNTGGIYFLLSSDLLKENKLVATRFLSNGNFESFDYIPVGRMNNSSIETIFIDDSLRWIGGSEGLLRFNQAFNQALIDSGPMLVKKLRLQNDSIIDIPVGYRFTGEREDFVDLSNTQNSFRIQFVSPPSIAGQSHQYRYWMENYEVGWSPWSSLHEKDYIKLNPGKYIFHVQARDLFGRETEVFSMGIIVKPPFYFTTFAFAVYIILLVSFLYTIITVRSYFVAKERIELEREIKERTDKYVKENERSEDLLLNMLPSEISKELRLKGKISTSKYRMVTVMFMDIQGFTRISEVLEPDLLVAKLDEFFHAVDGIIEKYHLEKIKTIGDGYMCAGGVPVKNKTNPIEMLLAALEVREYIKGFQFDESKTPALDWGLRIGVNTGPVIAGLIGDKRLSYDIWGITVNNASRLESNGVPGEINISEYTYELVKDYFITQSNGTLSMRSGSTANMYLVKGLKLEYRLDDSGYAMNSLLKSELTELRYQDLYETIMEMLDKELPEKLYYHNKQHTIDVVETVSFLAKMEQVDAESDLLLRTAALFHDIGYIVDFENHEQQGVKIARDMLPRFFYTPAQIDRIGELIMATKYPPSPENLYEAIICDADLDYLGRKDFIPLSRNLFMEFYERNLIKSVDEWVKTQIKFIEHHTYFTETAIKSREVNKNQQLDSLRKMDFLAGFF